MLTMNDDKYEDRTFLHWINTFDRSNVRLIHKIIIAYYELIVVYFCQIYNCTL